MGIFLLVIVVLAILFVKHENSTVRTIAKGVLITAGIMAGIAVIFMLMIAVPNFLKARDQAIQSKTQQTK